MGWSRLGLIAGGGDLPVHVAEACQREHRLGHVVALKTFADASRYQSASIRTIAELGGVIQDLKSAECDAVCFAGIVKRPDFNALKPDMKGLSVLPKLISAATQGDDALLRAVIAIFEKEGFIVIGAQELARELTGPAGYLGSVRSKQSDQIDIQKAMETAAAMGALDIGQGAVVCRGLVLAVEAQEGTDAMLDRVANLPEEIRGTTKDRVGVLAKRPKPGQELRIDLPAIGVSTVEKAAAAGLAGIVYPENGALILDQSEVVKAADRLGLFIKGLSQDDSAQ